MDNIPGNKNIPSWLHKIKFVLDPIGYMESNYKEFGDLFYAPISGNYNPYILVANPQVFQQLFSNNPALFDTVGSVYIKNFIGKNSVIAAEGKSHQRKRKLLMPSFHGDYLINYSKSIISLTEKNLKLMNLNQSFLAHDLMQKITLEVIINVIFGDKKTPRIHQLEQSLMAWLKTLNSRLISAAILIPSLQLNLGIWSPWGNYIHLKEKIAQLIYEEIQERRKNNYSSHPDVLTLLIEAKDQEGQGMTDEELHDEILGLLFAGHETSSAALAWAIYWIHRFSYVHQKLLEELDDLDKNGEVTMMNQLPYLNAVCYETLRLYPPLPKTITRIAKQPINLMGYDFPSGTAVSGSIYLCHRREDVYPQPQEFRPERFLKKKFSPYEFMPFGGGTRSCIGQSLALLEIKLVLGTILSRYQLKLADNRPINPKIRAMTLIPSGGVKMIFQGCR